jgi:preprotein translocase subunit YajC
MVRRMIRLKSRTLTTLLKTMGLVAVAMSVAPRLAYAQAAPGGAPSALTSLVPIIFMIVVMYFLIIRPQAKKQKAHHGFLANMKRGDQVVTSSGILGTIEGITDQFVTLEIAPDVRIKIMKTQIATAFNPSQMTAPEAKT